MHAILTLHEQIRTGEILRRREAPAAAPAVTIESPWTPEDPAAVNIGTPT
jgi:hypothetical protein